MAKTKILEHPLTHNEVEDIDRIIFLVVGVIVTLAVFLAMKVLNI